jgi:hypothetical protein
MHKQCASALPASPYHCRVLEIGSTLFQLIAVVVLCALVWSLPERSREERRRRVTGMHPLR